MRGSLSDWSSAAGDLLLGARCAGCDVACWGLCAGCRQALDRRQPRLTRPTPCPQGFPLTVAAGNYDALLKRLVSAHKERQILSLTPALGRQLAAAVHLLMDSAPASTSPTAACLVPMPSAAAAVRSRGFDASWALAGRAARELRTRWGIDAVPARLLAQRHGVHDQAGLDAQARQANLAGGLRVVRGAPSGRSIILIDDVVTTGSSLAEAARTLRAAGVAIRGAATVAATVRSRPERSERNWEVPDDSC